MTQIDFSEVKGGHTVLAAGMCKVRWTSRVVLASITEKLRLLPPTLKKSIISQFLELDVFKIHQQKYEARYIWQPHLQCTTKGGALGQILQKLTITDKEKFDM